MTSTNKTTILDAAIELARIRGYRSISLRAVAHKAKVSRPLIYYHFESRDALITMVLEEAIRRRDLKIAAQALILGEKLVDIPEDLKGEIKTFL